MYRGLVFTIFTSSSVAAAAASAIAVRTYVRSIAHYWVIFGTISRLPRKLHCDPFPVLYLYRRVVRMEYSRCTNKKQSTPSRRWSCSSSISGQRQHNTYRASAASVLHRYLVICIPMKHNTTQHDVLLVVVLVIRPVRVDAFLGAVFVLAFPT